MRGNSHDRAGAVVGQHVVGRPDRQPLAVHRVDRVAAQEDAGLRAVCGLPLDVGQLAHLGDIVPQGLEVLRGADLLGQRRVRRHHEERRPVQRVRAGGEDGDRLVTALDHEADVGPFGTADPVPLHQQDPVRPLAFQLGHVGQQALRVLGDLEVPLGQHAADDLGPAPLTPARDHLLVGQHGLVVRAPVDVAVLPVRQASLVEAQEQPLVPAVVSRVAGLQPPRPVKGHGVPAERRGLRLDVGVGPVGGVRVVPDRRVLGRQPERIPADGMQHVVVALEVVPGHRVGDGVRLGVAHVQIAGGVREHVQQVGARAGIVRVVAGPEQVALSPAGLPLFLDLAGVVVLRPLSTLGGCHGVSSALGRSGSGNRKAPRSRGAAAPTTGSVSAAM